MSGAYRARYLVDGSFRFLTEPAYMQWIGVVSGVVQTAVDCDFFYYSLKSWHKNEKLQLPS